MRFARCSALATAICALMATGQRTHAQTSDRAYCSITAIERRRLVNAVQLTIRADGLMAPDIQSSDLFNREAARMGQWDKVGKRVTAIPIRVWNARSQVGSIAHVGIYPVSHVEVTVPPESLQGIGVEVRVVLYQPALTREVRLAGDRWNFDTPNEKPPFVSIEQSQDRRSIIVVVTSDRRTPAPEKRRTPVDPDKRTLEVGFRDGLVSVYALDADLRDVVREMGRATGVSMAAAAGLERTASLSLDGVPLDDALSCIARTYGASLDYVGGVAYMADGAVGDPSAYRGSDFAEIRLHHISAEAARDALPDVLLGFVHLDAGRNALTVAGPRALVEKVSADLARMDRPVPMVEVTASAVEFEDASDLDALLAARLAWPGGSLQFDTGATDVVFSSLGQSAADLQTALRALTDRRRARLRAETRSVVLSGRQARMFVGQERRMASQYLDFWSDTLETRIIAIKIGTLLEVTPWTSGSGTITASVRAEASNVSAIEPKTGNPTISQRIAETTLRLCDGDTLYIGGLDIEQDLDRRRSALFGGLLYPRSRGKTTSRLAVFVTARTVAGSGARATGSEQGT